MAPPGQSPGRCLHTGTVLVHGTFRCSWSSAKISSHVRSRTAVTGAPRRSSCHFFFGNDSEASIFDNVILFDRLVVSWEVHYSCIVIINILGAHRNLNMIVIIYQHLNNEIC